MCIAVCGLTHVTAMALPPKFKGHRLVFSDKRGITESPEPVHTIEMYLDYVCPFSASMYARPIRYHCGL